jgi:hypothetical protein
MVTGGCSAETTMAARAFILHKANLSSGGKVTSIELADFLGTGKAGPEHQALIRLIGSFVESG